jgi:hypothetical protein
MTFLRRPSSWLVASIAASAIAYGVACKSGDDEPAPAPAVAAPNAEPENESPAAKGPEPAVSSGWKPEPMGAVLGNATGCSWRGDCVTTSWASTQCPKYSTHALCTGTSGDAGFYLGCWWGDAGCYAPNCGTYANTSESTCNTSAGCIYDAGNEAGACYLGDASAGTVCSTYSTNKTTCNTTSGCAFDGSACTGPTSSSCNLDAAVCGSTPGCGLDGGCYATGATCGLILDQTICNSTSGCSFSGSGCVTQCTGTTQSACTSVTGCIWDSGAYPDSGWVPFPGVAQWDTDTNVVSKVTYPDNTTTRGQNFATWLQGTTGAVVPWTVTIPFRDVDYITSLSTRFAYTSLDGGGSHDASLAYDAGGANSVADFTFDTPLGQDAGTMAGRVMFTDMHLTEESLASAPQTTTVRGVSGVPIFNTSYAAWGGAHECQVPEAGLTMQERVAEYLFFDLGSCGASGLPPAPQPSHWFSTETFTKDYCMAPSSGGNSGGCPYSCSQANSAVVWRNFDWTAIISGESDGGTWGDSGLGPSITFQVATANTQAALGTAADAGGPTTYTLATDRTTGSYQYDVSNAILPSKSGIWLRVTMTLSPDSTNQIAPILTAWQQIYDCEPSQ